MHNISTAIDLVMLTIVINIRSLQLLDLGQEYAGNIQTVAGMDGGPTISYLSLVLTKTDQSGKYECSPSNTGHDEVTVHIVQGELKV